MSTPSATDLLRRPGGQPRLELSEVTLCCVDTRSVPLALSAVLRCMQLANFGQVLFFGPDPGSARLDVPEGVTWVTIPALTCIEDYNRIMLRGLAPHVHTSHVLVVQWDGFITDPALWRDDFLDWDYIGAPWYKKKQPPAIGNGGFSLRSRRLLLALQDVPANTQTPEDEEICVNQRQLLADRHGIRIAPLALARDFACEYGRYRPSFGFHGMHNFAHVLPPGMLSTWLDSAPAEIIVHQHARKLVKALMGCGRAQEAMSLVRRRAAYMGWSPDQCLLMFRAGWRRILMGLRTPH